MPPLNQVLATALLLMCFLLLVQCKVPCRKSQLIKEEEDSTTESVSISSVNQNGDPQASTKWFIKLLIILGIFLVVLASLTVMCIFIPNDCNDIKHSIASLASSDSV